MWHYLNILVNMIYIFLDIAYYLDYKRMAKYLLMCSCQTNMGVFCYFMFFCFNLYFNQNKTKERKYASIFNIVIFLPCLIILKIKACIVYLLYILKFHLLLSKTIQKWNIHLKTNHYNLRKKMKSNIFLELSQ